MHSAYIMEIYIIYLRSRNVISRLCNKDRDQGSKGIWGLGIDRMVTYRIECTLIGFLHLYLCVE